MPFKRGHPGYKKPGTKHKTTLLMEERRAMFDEHISKKFLQIVDKARPEYVLDQFIGKPTETIKHEGLEFLFDKDEKATKLD